MLPQLEPSESFCCIEKTSGSWSYGLMISSGREFPFGARQKRTRNGVLSDEASPLEDARKILRDEYGGSRPL
jgi:hypothetical protein